MRLNRRLGVLVLLVVAVPFAGCGGRWSQGAKRTGGAPAQRALSPGTGFDPAWSPDGRQIAYVEARFTSAPGRDLVFDNPRTTPTARDAIAVWNLSTGRVRRLVPALAQGTFVSSLAWVNDSRIAYLCSDLRSRTPSMPRELGDDWDLPLYYRTLLKSVVLTDIPTGTSTLVGRGRRESQLERSSGDRGQVVLWECTSPGVSVRAFSLTVLDAAGREVRRQALPRGDWVGLPVGTVRTTEPVLVRRVSAEVDCLSTIEGGSYRDFYCPGRRISGVSGSSNGRALAIGEEGTGGFYVLKVLHVGSEIAVAVADNPYVLSRVAWSPDGRHLAYTRSSDGRIAIVDVPPIP